VVGARGRIPRHHTAPARSLDCPPVSPHGNASVVALQVKEGKFELGSWEPSLGQSLTYATRRISGGEGKQVLLALL
jgi:hypothetical protein